MGAGAPFLYLRTAGLRPLAQIQDNKTLSHVLLIHSRYEAQLIQGVHYPGETDRAHFQEANRQLYEVMQSDPTVASMMENVYPGILKGVQPVHAELFQESPRTRI